MSCPITTIEKFSPPLFNFFGCHLAVDFLCSTNICATDPNPQFFDRAPMFKLIL
jgi:hypothetical protein